MRNPRKLQDNSQAFLFLSLGRDPNLSFDPQFFIVRILIIPVLTDRSQGGKNIS